MVDEIWSMELNFCQQFNFSDIKLQNIFKIQWKFHYKHQLNAAPFPTYKNFLSLKNKLFSIISTGTTRRNSDKKNNSRASPLLMNAIKSTMNKKFLYSNLRWINGFCLAHKASKVIFYLNEHFIPPAADMAVASEMLFY